MLLLCRPLSAALQAAAPKEHDAANLSKAEEPCELASPGASQASKPLRDLVIIAVPGQHSRKPYIGRLLSPHLPKNPSCLEVRHGHLS